MRPPRQARQSLAGIAAHVCLGGGGAQKEKQADLTAQPSVPQINTLATTQPDMDTHGKNTTEHLTPTYPPKHMCPDRKSQETVILSGGMAISLHTPFEGGRQLHLLTGGRRIWRRLHCHQLPPMGCLVASRYLLPRAQET